MASIVLMREFKSSSNNFILLELFVRFILPYILSGTGEFSVAENCTFNYFSNAKEFVNALLIIIWIIKLWFNIYKENLQHIK
jgi:hypothetical protein